MRLMAYFRKITSIADSVKSTLGVKHYTVLSGSHILMISQNVGILDSIYQFGKISKTFVSSK